MAHLEKYARGAIGHMFGHYDRSKEVPDLPAPEQTALNYNLAQSDQPLKQLDFLHQRLGEVRMNKNRKDVIVMADCVITLPQSIQRDSDDMVRFFSAAYDFLRNRYGAANTISAYVHMDEKTPHMHYSFMPITEDKKRGGEKLCAKEVITRADLRSFHTDLGAYMETIFGRDVGIENGTTKNGNRSISELKRGTAQAELERCEEKIKASKRELRDIQRDEEWIAALSPKKLLKGLLNGDTLKDIERLKEIALSGLRAAIGYAMERSKNEKLKLELARSVKKPSPVVLFERQKQEQELREKAELFDLLPREIQERARQVQEQNKKQHRRKKSKRHER